MVLEPKSDPHKHMIIMINDLDLKLNKWSTACELEFKLFHTTAAQ